MIPLANFDALLVLGAAFVAGCLTCFGILGLVLWAWGARKGRRAKRAAKREEMRRVRSPLFEVPSGQTSVDGERRAA